MAVPRAYDLWNMGETTFPVLGYGAGSGRNMCTRVGVSSVMPLDLNPEDGLTDTPPFMASDAYTLQPAIPAQIMVPLINHYTIAFWKRFLEGDGGTSRTLSMPARIGPWLSAVAMRSRTVCPAHGDRS